MSKKSWKDFLLSSGLPLENDVRKFLNSQGYIGRNEYSYVRQNEHDQEREFSYDIDTSYIKNQYYAEFMVECKYRHESTIWVFSPDEYGGPEENSPTDFLHAFDHFTDRHFYLKHQPFPIFGKLCQDGIEISSSGHNEQSITHAVAQLSYAMPEKIVSAIDRQYSDTILGRFIYLHIPILLTTAKLYRMKEDTTLQDVLESSEIEQIATIEESIILKKKPSAQLSSLSREAIWAYVRSVGETNITDKMNTFTKDINHFIEVISDNYCPTSVAIVHFSKEGGGLKKLMEYLNGIMDPSQEIMDAIKEREAYLASLSSFFDEAAARANAAKMDDPQEDEAGR